MYPVTQDYIDKIKASPRQVFGKLQVDFTDWKIDQSIAISANENAAVSYPQQVADALQTPTHKYASLDGSWVLDGTYYLAPDSADGGQMGWWGSQLAGVGGAFAVPYPKLTVNFLSRPIHAFKVVGDDKRAEYPVDFAIKLYGAGDTLLHTETVTGNAGVVWTKNIASVNSVVKTTLEITKWSHVGRQVKILEFFTSIQESYEGDDIISINLLEERDVSSGSLPIGNISANEIDIKINNINDWFDAGNVQSPLYELLKANRRIKAWLGIIAENIASSLAPTFTRNSAAYKQDGSQVLANVPRYEKNNYGTLLVEGTVNIVKSPKMNSAIAGNGVVNDFTFWINGANVVTPTLDTVKQAQKIALTTAVNTGTVASLYQKYIPCLVGEAVSASVLAELQILTGLPTCILVLKFVNSSNVVLVEYRSTYITTNSQATLKIENKVAPAGTAYAQIECAVEVSSLSSTSNIWFSKVQVEKKAYCTAFVNGIRMALYSDATAIEGTVNLVKFPKMDTDSNGDGVVDGFYTWAPAQLTYIPTFDVVKKMQKIEITGGTIITDAQLNSLYNPLTIPVTPGQILSASLYIEVVGNVIGYTVIQCFNEAFAYVAGSAPGNSISTFGISKVENYVVPVGATRAIITECTRPLAIGSTGSAWSKNAQLELKDHCTDFVDGVRPYGYISNSIFKEAITIEEGTTNHSTNPDMETGNLTGYSLPGGGGSYCTLSNQNVIKFSGNYALALTKGTDESQVSTSHSYAVQGANTLGNVSGKTVTVSAKVKASRIGIAIGIGIWRNGGDWQGNVSVIISDGTWQTISIMFTFNTSDTNSCVTRLYFSDHFTSDPGDIIYIDNWQVEEKPYCTSFINGTRANEVLTIPMNVVNLTEGAIECWVYVNTALKNTAANRYIFAHDPNGDNHNRISLAHYMNNNWNFALYDNSGVISEINCNDTLVIGWHRFACRWSASEAAFFIDDVKIGSVANPHLPSIPTTVMHIGVWRAGNYGFANTLIDDLRISDIARTDAEILAAYQANKPLERDDYTTYLMHLDANLYPVEMCWVPLGTYWSNDWEVPENEIYAHTSGRDRMELLRMSTYSSSQVSINTTLYDLAIAVLEDAGLTEEEYWVDTELQDYPVPYAWFESQSHREALRKIAEACMGQCYCSREGIVRIEGPSFLDSPTAVLAITNDDIWKKDNPVKWSEIANYVEVSTNPLKPVSVAEEIYRSNAAFAVAAGGQQSITAYYNSAPCIEAVASLVGATNTIISTATYYAWGANITLSNPGGSLENVTVVINGKPLKVLNKEKAIAQDIASITDNGKLKYTFPDNDLIQTLAVAQAIADKILATFKSPKRDVSLDWRGNPALELADRINAPDYKDVSTQDYYVISQTLDYDGTLRGTTKGRKAV